MSYGDAVKSTPDLSNIEAAKFNKLHRKGKRDKSHQRHGAICLNRKHKICKVKN